MNYNFFNPSEGHEVLDDSQELSVKYWPALSLAFQQHQFDDSNHHDIVRVQTLDSGVASGYMVNDEEDGSIQEPCKRFNEIETIDPSQMFDPSSHSAEETRNIVQTYQLQHQGHGAKDHIPAALKALRNPPIQAAERGDTKPRSKFAFTPENKMVMERVFQQSPYPRSEDKVRIANEFGVTIESVSRWFERKRKSRGIKKQDYLKPVVAGSSSSSRDRASSEALPEGEDNNMMMDSTELGLVTHPDKLFDPSQTPSPLTYYAPQNIHHSYVYQPSPDLNTLPYLPQHSPYPQIPQATFPPHPEWINLPSTPDNPAEELLPIPQHAGPEVSLTEGDGPDNDNSSLDMPLRHHTQSSEIIADINREENNLAQQRQSTSGQSQPNGSASTTNQQETAQTSELAIEAANNPDDDGEGPESNEANDASPSPPSSHDQNNGGDNGEQSSTSEDDEEKDSVTGSIPSPPSTKAESNAEKLSLPEKVKSELDEQQQAKEDVNDLPILPMEAEVSGMPSKKRMC